MTTLVLKFKKRESNDATKYSNFYSNSKTIINESYTDDVLELIYGTITLNIYKYRGKGSCLLSIDPGVRHAINISKYNSLASSSYIKFPKELDHPKKV